MCVHVYECWRYCSCCCLSLALAHTHAFLSGLGGVWVVVRRKPRGLCVPLLVVCGCCTCIQCLGDALVTMFSVDCAGLSVIWFLWVLSLCWFGLLAAQLAVLCCIGFVARV